MSNSRNIVLLIILFLALFFGWQWLMLKIWPIKPAKPTRETVAMVMGGGITGTELGGGLKQVGKPQLEEAVAQEPPKKEPEPKNVGPQQIKAADPANPSRLVALGHGEKPYFLRVLFNTRGGSVQQVILSEFVEADREGREVKDNGNPRPLHLVPGVIRPRADSLRGQRKVPRFPLKDGIVSAEDEFFMTVPSYVMYHYEKPNDERPLDTLGEREWKIVDKNIDETADEQSIVFQTELNEPHNLVITKTYTLKRKEYHIGMRIDIEPKPGLRSVEKFRYQLTGAHGLPIEGEWFTSTFHQAIVGFGDDKGKSSRFVEDAREIRSTEGSDRQTRTEKLAIRYAAVAVQYFASAIAVDDEQTNRRFIEFVRATPFGPKPPGNQEFLNDVTVRAITEEFNPNQVIAHKYLLYQGPIKVRLLRQMPGDKAVDDGLVARYLDKLNLDTMTDAPMSNWFGRFANSIYWTDLVIAFTNLIHSLIWLLSHIVPNLGICILFVTLIVRGLLFPLSRRQAYNTMVMQQKMAKLQPELKKLQEKHAGDFHTMNQERLKLYREHGVNPFAALGGCFMLLLQMPVFMGLYYALQESIFFRLEGFLWMENLAAPDMMIFWSEKIPFVSTPNDIGSTLYLGPYFNALPILAVVLMLYQQKTMMPPSDDPQVQAQQRMMKFMMIIFGLFFYKVAAGLCLYFIASSIWGLAERKFAPKPKPQEEGDNGPGDTSDEPPKPLGWWGRKKAAFKERWKEVLEQAQKQAEHRREQQQKQQPGSTSPPDRSGGGGKKKKKKKR